MSWFPVLTAAELGIAIRDRRRELGWDQARLAAAVGVSRQWISEVERGKPRAEVGLVFRTARALGLELWAGTEPRPARRRAAPPVDIDAIVERGRRR